MSTVSIMAVAESPNSFLLGHDQYMSYSQFEYLQLRVKRDGWTNQKNISV